MRWAAVAESLRSPGPPAVTVLRDLMNTRVVAVTADTPLAAAAADMVETSVGSAVVMQGPFLLGILTERDVLRAAASGEDLSASAVSAWMTPDPQSASPDTSVEDAAQIMLLNGFRHLPVVDGRTVCGVVSLRDLFAARIRRPLPR
jgi:CBS domain-containing protein